MPQRRVVRYLLLTLLLLAGGSVVAQAQARPEIDIRVTAQSYPPLVAVRNVLEEQPFGELLRNGFPARLHIRAEVWTVGRYFDDVRGRAEWDVIVQYNVIEKSYEVARLVGERVTPLGSYLRFADARAASELAYLPTLPTPRRGQKGYILVQAELQTLDVSDLDEVERWLRGEATPAVRGKRSPASALTRGVRTLASRILGGEVRQLEARSPTMTF
ncbi:hypothetical protein [Gemmatimonas phototrophica]|uniref:DUF4390 domain-containing protein n=1 Tax=Gemmatimonas phototrophica TaxID=1379270 RepID=A0A143BHY9_9BACT|nr:hypothetical protein [Gemmatimonas phototrophica]AMW04233.1 hypothetical protein GEMMAAP_04025 [Gemmatimonas phototrophica]